jgi:hypothetical protein
MTMDRQGKRKEALPRIAISFLLSSEEGTRNRLDLVR